MKFAKYTLAGTEVLLIFPALLFMTALFVRNLTPMQYEPAHTAQQIVTWYATHPPMGLWILLIALPLTVLATGAVTLVGRWRTDSGLREAARQTVSIVRAHLATVLIAGATLAAGAVLAIVALHLVTA